MSAPASTKFQLNIKTPAGSLFNIYADDYTEFSDLLDAVESLSAKIAGTEGLFVGATAVAPIAAPPTQQNVPPAVAAAPAADGSVLCHCGQPAKLVPAGVAKATGKPYRAFHACNGQRGAQCDFRLTA